MPTYEYACGACDHRFEQWQSFSAAALTDCPRCGQPRLVRLFGSGGAIIFKGSGFYETDYRRPQSQRQAEKNRQAQDSTAPSASSNSASSPGNKADSSSSGSGTSRQE